MKTIILTLVLCCIAISASAKSKVLTKQDSAFIKNVTLMDEGTFVKVTKTIFSEIYLTLAHTDFLRVYVLKKGFIKNVYEIQEDGTIIYYAEE